MPGDGHIGGDLEREPGNGSDDGEDSPDDDVFDGMDVPRQGEDVVFDPGDGALPVTWRMIPRDAWPRTARGPQGASGSPRCTLRDRPGPVT